MSVIVRLYTFSKRDNSTKLPDSNPVEFSCLLKEECGVINPVIILHNVSNPSPYNYAYIPTFSRYYWIREWTWVLGRWEADLYTDVLATFRGYIGNSEQYVVRSSNEYDGNITDSLYPTIAIDESAMNTIGAPLAGNLSTGTYVIGIINKNGGYGAVQYFALSASDFVSVCAVMFSANPGWYDLSAIAKTTPTDITEVAFPTEVMKSLTNPMQYVVSCMFFPDSANIPTQGSDRIFFGWWDSGVTGDLLKDTARSHKDIDYTIPSHPQAYTRGNFLNLSPFTKVTLNAGLFGYFPIDTSFFAETLAGQMTIGIDAITGEGVLFVKNDQGHVMSVHRAQVGVPIKLAQITRDYLQTLSNGVQTGSDIIGGVIDTIKSKGLAGKLSTGAETVARATNGIVSTIKSAMPTLLTSGSGGSMYELNRGWTITAQHFILAEEDNANRGRPLAKKRILKNIPGYIMVEDADVETSGLGEETALIKQYMEGGFFYE